MMQHRIGLNGEQNRGRVGQARRLYDQPLERGDGASLILVEKIAQRLHQVLAHSAANTAIAKQNGLLIDSLHEMMVQPHCAELINQYGRATTLGGCQDAAQQSGFAAS
jgi:hypothetical protein